MLMQNFGVTNKEHYGMLWYFLEWAIQLQEKSPAFDILNGSRKMRLSLKERKFIFLPTFSLSSSSSLLKREFEIRRLRTTALSFVCSTGLSRANIER